MDPVLPSRAPIHCATTGLEKNLHRGNYQNSYMKFFLFIFTDSILRVEKLRVIAQGRFSPASNCLDNSSAGMDFSMEVKPDFSALCEIRSEAEQ